MNDSNRLTEDIEPSYFCWVERDATTRTLLYSHSLKSCIITNSAKWLGAVSMDFSGKHISVQRIVKRREDDNVREELALSSDASLIAMASCEFTQWKGYCHMLSIYQMPNVITDLRVNLMKQRYYSILPDFGSYSVSSLKFFPDGKRIIAALVDPIQKDEFGTWCRIYKLPENLWNEARIPTTSDDNSPDNRELKTCEYEDINVVERGLIAPEIFESRERNSAYSNFLLNYGFHSLAISPDTTRILIGCHNGEIFIFETSTLKLLERVRGYVKENRFGKEVMVIGSHYNPGFAHHEFVACGNNYEVKIWRVDELEDGLENVHTVHQLSLQPELSRYSGGCSCNYSPDGKLVAVTCEEDVLDRKNFIIDSRSGNILYSLVHTNNTHDCIFNPYNDSLCHNMFVGNVCQVAAINYDDRFCIWKLPVVYSLETLCFLVIKATVKYDNVDQLCLPSLLKLRLKYLYV